jgi:thiol-disulfide isomerase/thioredoxin
MGGQTAPPLAIERTIPPGVEIARDRPLVLEFWATWCANCVAEIPHWNALVGKFPDVQFVSISDEAAGVVESFLAKQPIRGVIALDRDGATFRAYGVEGRPVTVLIDRAGVVRGRMHPGQVGEATIADLAAGREAKPTGLPGRLRIMEDAARDPLFAVMLRPSDSPKPGYNFLVDAGKLEANNIPVKALLSYAWRVGERLIDGPEALLAARYDFCVLLPNGRTGDVALLRDMLERSFRLKIRREARVMEAVIMKAAAPLSGPDNIASLGRVLEFRLKRPVIDETGSESYRHFQLPENPDELEDALKTRLGITLSYETRPVERLVVESMELPAYRMR